MTPVLDQIRLKVQFPAPHTGQQAVLSSPARFKWVAAGRRWRKTTMFVSLAAQAALKGKLILWGAPTYDQCRIAWGELYKAVGDAAQFRENRMQVDFPTGGVILFRSLDDPDNARGHTADGLVVDEAAQIWGEAWYAVLRPIISDTGGWALVGGTPRGRNWFWREWHKAHIGEAKDAAAWQAPTLGVAIENGQLVRRPHPLENSQFAFEEAVKIYESLPERVFQQEFLSEFVEDAGGVFRGVSLLATAAPQDRFIPGHQYVLGVDLGRRVDFTAITVLDISVRPAECVYVDRFKEIAWSLQVERIKALVDRFKAQTVVVDQTGVGDPVVERLQRELSS